MTINKRLYSSLIFNANLIKFNLRHVVSFFSSKFHLPKFHFFTLMIFNFFDLCFAIFEDDDILLTCEDTADAEPWYFMFIRCLL